MKLKFTFFWVIVILLNIIFPTQGAGEETLPANNGYILVLPEHFANRYDLRFTLGYCSTGELDFHYIGSWKLYDQVTQNIANWIWVDRRNGVFLFPIGNSDQKSYDLYSLSISDNIVWSKFKIPVNFIAEGWKINDSPTYVLNVIEKENSKPEYVMFAPMKSNGISPVTSANQLLTPAFGNFSLMKADGGPHFLWSPKTSKLRFWLTYPKLSLPQLPKLPPKELYAEREESQWLFRGDLKGTYLLFSNPYYYEVQKGLKTRAGIFLNSLDKWLIINLTGTECYPIFFEKWLVFEICNIDPKSRPENFYGYPASQTGEFVFINLENGQYHTLAIGKNASILYVGANEAIFRTGNAIYRISLNNFPEVPEKTKICEGEMVQYVEYAVPASRLPTVTAPDNLEISPQNSSLSQ